MTTVENRPALDKIERLSGVMQGLLAVALFGAVAIPIIVIGFMVTVPTADGPSYFAEQARAGAPLTADDDALRDGKLNLRDKFGASVFLTIYMGCYAWMFWNALRLMQRFKHHEIFGARSVRYSRNAALGYLASVVIGTVGIWGVALATGDLKLNGELWRSFISLGFCWFFVWIMQIGTSLHTESELTV